MKQKYIIFAAKCISALFSPLYISFIGFCIIFFLSYMRMLPLSMRLGILLVVYITTILLPSVLILIYRKVKKWTTWEIVQQEKRMVPYFISIACYFTCYYILSALHMPHFMGSIVITALLIQIFCAMINVRWKISTHSAAIGGLLGAYFVISMMFMFNSLFWFCVILLLAGLIGSARMILRQHTLSQVVTGFVLGVLCGLFVMIYV